MISGAGLTQRGAFVVLAAGWGNVPSRGGKPPIANKKRYVLALKICRSEDGCRTWTRTEMKVPPQMHYLIRYRNIVGLPGRRLAISCYSHNPNDISRNTAWVFFSDDDGRTWGNARVIAEDSYNETALLPLYDGKLIAVSRTMKWRKNQDEHLESFLSDDGG